MTAHAPPAVLTAPAAFEANAGVFSGRAPRGTTTVRVLVDGRRLHRVALRPARRGSRSGRPACRPRRDDHRALPARREAARTRVVRPVFGLPAASWRVVRPRRVDARAQRALRGSSAGGATSAVWAAGLEPGGRAASWNAGAAFTGASTLKLAILLCTLAHDDADPVTSGWFSTYQQMILDSSNSAADAVLTHLGGSISGGSAIVDSCIDKARHDEHDHVRRLPDERRGPSRRGRRSAVDRARQAHDRTRSRDAAHVARPGDVGARSGARARSDRAQGPRRGLAAAARALPGARAPIDQRARRPQGRLARHRPARCLAGLHAARHPRARRS